MAPYKSWPPYKFLYGVFTFTAAKLRYLKLRLFKRTPTQKYLVITSIVFSILLMTFTSVIYKQYSSLQKLNDLTIYNHEIIRQSRAILMDLVDMESGVRGYLLTKKKKFLEPYNDSKDRIDNRIRDLRHFTKDDLDSQYSINEWLDKIDSFSAILNMQIVSTGVKVRKAFYDNTLESQKKQLDELRILLEKYVKSKVDLLNEKMKLSKQKQQTFAALLIFGTILGISAMVAATLIILSLIKSKKKSEDEIRQVESKYLMVMSGVNDGLYEYNLIDKSMYISSTYKAMLGYNDDEMESTVEAVHKCVHPDDITTAYGILDDYLQGKIPVYSYAFRMLHKDGSWIWVLSRGVGIKNYNGEYIKLVGTHTDITEQKKREEELKQLNNELENFTYIASHDLRAPLVNLRGFANEIKYVINKVHPIFKKVEDSLDAREKEYVTKSFKEDLPESIKFIEQSVTRMDTLTSAVLDLSRIGKHEYKHEEVDPNVIVKRCLDSLAYEIADKEIALEISPLPKINSDALAIEQIFSNIIDNAIKYLSPNRKGKITIFASETENHTVFSVIDNGRGIAEIDKIRVFQIFKRARNTSDIRGIGIGMTFVQTTLRKLGGNIWFDSVEDSGTSFHFNIPKAKVIKGVNL